MVNKRLVIILSTIILLLLIPLVAMHFTNEEDWSMSDFVKMGVLLLTAGLGCELVMRKVKKLSHRLLLCAAILLAFLLIWAELAVGLLGTPFAGS